MIAKIKPMAVPHRTVSPLLRATMVEGRLVFPAIDRTDDRLASLKLCYGHRLTSPATRRVE